MSKFLIISVLIAFCVIGSFDCHSTGNRLKKRQIFYDLCTPNRCQNGGSCFQSISGTSVLAYCACTSGYTGIYCQTTSLATLPPAPSTTTTTTTTAAAGTTNSLCSLITCQNGGKCVVTGTNLIQCFCPAGYTGAYCQFGPATTTTASTSLAPATTTTTVSVPTTITASTATTTSTVSVPTTIGASTTTTTVPKVACPSGIPNPCQNGGVCLYSNVTNQLTCSCAPTYTDAFCTTRIAFCTNSPCKNGGTCTQIDAINGSCTCAATFTGTYCDVGTVCPANYCLNNQPCLVIDGVPRCFCAGQFTPPNCA